MCARLLKPDGSWMIRSSLRRATEAGGQSQSSKPDVLHAASTMICVPTSLDQPVEAAFGAQAGPSPSYRRRSRRGGFGAVRKATETPFNMVLEGAALDSSLRLNFRFGVEETCRSSSAHKGTSRFRVDLTGSHAFGE